MKNQEETKALCLMNSQVKRKVKALCDETPWNRGDINSICFEETILEAGKYSETEIRI